MFKLKNLKFLQFLISQKHPKGQPQVNQEKRKKLTDNLKKNLEVLKDLLGTGADVVYREFNMGTEGRPPAALVLIDGLVENNVLHEHIIRPLMVESRILPEKYGIFPNYNIEVIENTLITVGDTKKIYTFEEIIENVLSGNTVH